MSRIKARGLIIVLITAVAAIFFISGLVVGFYRLPPFNVSALKNLPFSGRVNTFFIRLRGDDALADVVMLGDSITESGNWTKLFDRPDVLNLGISGDTSAGILNRLHQVIAHKPRIVFLMIGVNDFLHDIPLDLTKYHIRLIVSLLIKNDIRPIIQSTLFVRGYPEVNAKIRALNDDLRLWCAENKITFVDLNEFLSLNGMLRADVSNDGIHLNGNGYVLWGDAIRRYFNDASRSDVR
jgi:lysophospholipase L1-like esterase